VDEADRAAKFAKLMAETKAVWQRAHHLREHARRLRLRAQVLRHMAQPSAHDLVPLEIAATAIMVRVYEHRPGETVNSRELDLDAVCYTIAMLCPIYTHDDTGGGLRMLTQDEISIGVFRRGARELHFVDGRPAVFNLAVPADKVPSIVSAINAALREPQPGAG
jgi:hypothetical protein